MYGTIYDQAIGHYRPRVRCDLDVVLGGNVTPRLVYEPQPIGNQHVELVFSRLAERYGPGSCPLFPPGCWSCHFRLWIKKEPDRYLFSPLFALRRGELSCSPFVFY